MMRKLIRRWFVPRAEYDEMREALQVARSLIVLHHDCSVRQSAGMFCPVCHHEDGTEPEMDRIHAALRAPTRKQLLSEVDCQF